MHPLLGAWRQREVVAMATDRSPYTFHNRSKKACIFYGNILSLYVVIQFI